MSTAGIDPNMAHNIAMLQKQSMKVEFCLEHTNYQKVENIGTGAYGVVCSAINKKTKQKVAIKKIPNLFTLDPRYAIRTYREIKILQHFKHDNVIAIREILQPPKKDITDIYVVMDLMESDLHRIIYSRQSLTDEHVKYFLYQILRGLKYIHSAHVIHRDLKPSNLLVNADCELKIGDFGMARGINFVAVKSNIQLTHYVATRWYRAPEIIVSIRQGYGAAIDMWSVGCIFAELLTRKHLFPGRDLLNQLAMIFGTLGIPSQKYLDSLDSETVCGFLRKVTETNEVKRKTYAQLCPKASADAIDLLSKMLVIEPEKRISIEEALEHPFLSKYHDVRYEPKCSRVFDFSFENEINDMQQSDEQKRNKLQELLKKEVMQYKKPDVMDFGSLIQSKSSSVTQKSSKDDPYAELQAFIAKLASPVSEEKSISKDSVSQSQANSLLSQPVTTSSYNPLLATQSNPLLAEQTNSLLADQTQSKNSLLALNANPLLATQQNSLLVNQGNSLLEAQGKSLLASQGNPLLPGQNKGSGVGNSLLEAQDNAMINSHQAKKLPSQENPLLAANNVSSNPLLAANHKVIDRDSSIQPSKEASFTKLQDHLKMNNNRTSFASESDQSNDTDLFTTLLVKLEHSTEDKKLNVDTLAKPSTDDIEMLSAKLEQTDLKQGGTTENKLTIDTLMKPSSEDIDMLSAKLDQANMKENLQNKVIDAKSRLRQRIMEQQNKKPTSVPVSQSQTTTGKPVVTAYQRQKERKEQRKQRELKALQNKKKRKSQAAENSGISSQLLTREDQRMLERWRNMAKPHTIQPKATGSSKAIVTTAPNIIVVYPNLSQAFVTATTSTHGVLPTTQISISQTMGSAQTGQIANNPQTQVMIVHQTPATQTMTHSQSYQDSSQNGVTGVHQPTRSFSDVAVHRMSSHELVEDSREDSFYDLPPSDTNDSLYHQQHQPERPAAVQNSHQRQMSLADWSNTSMNTTLDLGDFIKPKNMHNESLPARFVSTPKGTGGGYGVGFDLESMMTYSNVDTNNVNESQLDSAPLSASLLADWMDVTGNMDPQALEEIQHELNSALIDDFPFTNY